MASRRQHSFKFALLLFAKLLSVFGVEQENGGNVLLEVDGRPYASPSSNSTFTATVQDSSAPESGNATLYVFRWSIGSQIDVIKNETGNQSSFCHEWDSTALPGLYEILVSVKAQNGSVVGANLAYVVVTNAYLSLDSTSPSVPGCNTTVEVNALNTSIGDPVQKWSYFWSVRNRNDILIINRTEEQIDKIRQLSVPFLLEEDGLYTFHVELFALMLHNDERLGSHLVTTGRSAVKISEKIEFSIDVIPPPSSLDVRQLCSTCCSVPGLVKFATSVHNPNNCLNRLGFAWKFFGGSVFTDFGKNAYVQYNETTTYNYTLEVTGRHGILEVSGRSHGSICIEDPVENVTIAAPKKVSKKEEFNVTVSCFGSHPVVYCYVTCEEHEEECTGLVEGSVTILLTLQNSGPCYVNFTAKNNASDDEAQHMIEVQDTNNIPTTVSYTVPAVVGTILCVVLIVFLVTFYHQYKAYRRRHIEVADFDYLGRSEPPSRWERLKQGVKSKLGMKNSQKSSNIPMIQRYGSLSS